MARTEWGSPSLAQDIANNFHKTHHEEFIIKDLSFIDRVKFAGGKNIEIEKEKIFVKNDKEYLDSKNTELIAPSNKLVKFSEHYLNKDNFFKEEKEFFQNNDEEIEYFSENNFDAHGNYMDDNYFFKRDYEGSSCYLDFNEEECAF